MSTVLEKIKVDRCPLLNTVPAVVGFAALTELRAANFAAPGAATQENMVTVHPQPLS